MQKSLEKSPYSIKFLTTTLLLVLAIIGLVTYSTFIIAIPFGLLHAPQNRLAVFLTGAIAGELAAFGLLTLRLRQKQISLKALGLGKTTNWKGITLAFIAASIYIACSSLNPSISKHLLQFSTLKLLAIVAALVAGLVEETIFRGYVMTTLDKMHKGKFTQVIVSGIIFGLAHAYGFVGLPALLITFGTTFILGSALAVVYLVGNRSLTPTIIGHTLIDLIIEPWLLLSFFTGTV